MNLLEKLVLTTIATAGLVFGVINFVTMKNEHHETLDLISSLRPLIETLRPPPAPPAARGGSELAAVRAMIDCPKAGPRTMVNLAIGQSNASNFAGLPSRSEHAAHIVEFFQGRCYLAEDPLIGADGYSGSPWVMLANRLIDAETYDNVVIATMGRGGTSIQDWRTGGRLNGELRDLSFALAVSGLPATTVMWVQGEAERSPAALYNNAERYSTALGEVIESARQTRQPRFSMSRKPVGARRTTRHLDLNKIFETGSLPLSKHCRMFESVLISIKSLIGAIVTTGAI